MVRLRAITIALATFMVASQVLAECSQQYKKFLRLNIGHAISYPLSSSVQTSSAFSLSLQGTLLGATLTNTNLTTAKVFLGALLFIDNYFSFEDVVYDLKAYKSRVKAMKIIEESYLGLGFNIDELTDILRRQYTGGEFPYTTRDIAQIIQDGAEQRIFCPEKGRVFTQRKLVSYVKYKLSI